MNNEIENIISLNQNQDTGPFKNHKGFPNCCGYHQEIFEELNRCRDIYLSIISGYEKVSPPFENYRNRIISRILLTEYHLNSYIDKEDWLEDIQDYIFYNIVCINYPEFYDFYLIKIKTFLDTKNNFSLEKVQLLNKYIGDFLKSDDEKSWETKEFANINWKWFKSLPQELGDVVKVGLKSLNLKKIGFKNTRFNKYLGIVVNDINTTEEALEVINDLTKSLLQNIDIIELSKTGYSPKEEVNNALYRVKSLKLFDEYSGEEKRYLKVLIKWLGYTQYYLKEKPLIDAGQLKLIGNNDTEALEKIIKDLSREENRFIKGFPMDFVISHFRVFLDKKSKNKAPFLNPEEFINFIKRGFLGYENIPKPTFNLSSGEKGLIIKRFYEFYSHIIYVYGDTTPRKYYINLILENFANNWKESEIKCFFKPGIIIAKW